MSEVSVIVGKPPIFEKILSAFPLAERASTIFAYDNAIYVSEGVMLTPALIKHEKVHLQRQNEVGADAWWEKYLVDHDFRYAEEVLAHRAEYWVNMRAANNPDVKHRIGVNTAKRLIAPLYRFDVTFEKAYKDITGRRHGH